MGGDLRRVGWWVWRCGWAAWVFVALSAPHIRAESLDEARAATARAERAVGLERARARELAERALDPDFLRETTDGEELQRFEREIADARTRLAAAERNLQHESSRLATLEATLAKTRASIGHANAERRRLTARLGNLERKIASGRVAKPKARASADEVKKRSRARRASR